MTNEIVIQASDVEDLRYVLKACQTYLQARDLMEAQITLTTVRPSALTLDAERVANRLDYYFSQFLIERHEALLEEEDAEVEEDVEDDPRASEGLPGASERPLSDAPLGKPKVSRQKGRRLTAEELTPSDE